MANPGRALVYYYNRGSIPKSYQKEKESMLYLVSYPACRLEIIKISAISYGLQVAGPKHTVLVYAGAGAT